VKLPGLRFRWRVTREGWWCLSATLGLGMAGLNTGNNLVYLLCSLLLALILVSGVISECTLWGLGVRPVLPGEAYAGTPALVGAVVANRKRRLPSLSLTLEVPDAGSGLRFLHLPRLDAGEERLATWTTTFPARGRHGLAGVWLTTRFPFGLFTKSGAVAHEAELLVYPAVRPVSARQLLGAADSGPVARRRRGRGDDLYDLRPYRPGDDPRMIHWPSSARAQALTVRELEDEATRDVRIVLAGDGRREPARCEAALSEAASLAVHLLRRGAAVELAGPGLAIPLGRGRGQETRILTALALFEPGGAGGAAGSGGSALREVRIPLD
jgi:uncharacterized protein (DUF58 family)